MKTLILGDVCPTVNTEEAFQNEDVETLFTDVKTLFEGNDINFVNLECAMTECGKDKEIKKFGACLKTGIKTAKTLAKLGVTLAGISNNHVFDYGKRGAIDTINALTESGIDYTGFGDNYEDSRRNYVVERDGERVAIIAVCEHEYSYALEDRMGSRPFDVFDTLDDIRKAKSECDRVIVIYHGGKEYCAYPSPRVYKSAHAMAEAGADLIIGQHSHCICCYEEYKGSHILYGQGNFNFLSVRFPDVKSEWNRCLAVKYDTKENKVEFVPIVVYDKKGVTLAKGELYEEIMNAFAERNESLKNGTWKDGWHEFCMNATDYVKRLARVCAPDATERETDVFSHYLDCEAHTDVWREIFPSYNLTNEK